MNQSQQTEDEPSSPRSSKTYKKGIKPFITYKSAKLPQNENKSPMAEKGESYTRSGGEKWPPLKKGEANRHG